MFLEREGDIRVEGVGSAEIALERLRENRYDAIVSDYQMPGMDGIAFLKQLRESGDATPFIILTGKGREQVAIEALNSGADFYLQKGTDPKIGFIELRNLILQAATRRHAVEALVESERRLAEIIDFLPDATFAIDTTGRVIAWNQAIAELTGVPAREMMGKGGFEYAIPMYGERRPVLIDLVSEPPEEVMKYPYRDVHREGGVLTAETISAKPRGRSIILWARASPLRNSRGETIGAIESVRDITEKKRAEAALLQSEERYRNLAEASQDLIYIIDRDDNVVYLNSRALELLGMRKEEVVGRPRALLFPPDRNQTMKGNLRQVFSTGEPVRVESAIPFGERISWQDTTLIPLRSPEGTVTCVMGISRDITERKMAEEALRESEEKYRALVEQANDGIIVVQDEVVKFCNRKAAEMWGGDIQEILGQPYLNFIDPGDVPRVQENYQHRMAGEVIPWQYDVVLLRKDGSKLPAELNAGNLIFEGRPASLILFRDMTERRMAEEALKNVNRKLNLLSSVTRHDLLNQVMVITGYLGLARSGTSLGEVKELLDLAGKAAVIMHRQIEFTRQYQDIGIHSPVWQDLREAIAKAVPGSGTGVKIFLDIDRVSIYADPLIERVFANLIENALIHGETVTTIRFSARVTGPGLTILCEDDGIGIPVREKEKIFSPGYGRNTGFGLFLVREILGITGATIREIGQEGKGAIFEITLPGDAYRIGG